MEVRGQLWSYFSSSPRMWVPYIELRSGLRGKCFCHLTCSKFKIPSLERKVKHYTRKLIMKESKNEKWIFYLPKKQINGYILS